LTGADRLALVFQEPTLLPWRDAVANITLTTGATRDRAQALMAEVGLAGHEDQFPRQMSLGQQRRLSLARAFAASPDILLMDEPFAALDAQTRIVMHHLLTEIWQKHRATVLFVTHDVDEALLLADRVCVMSQAPGRIIRDYALDLPRPRSLRAQADVLLPIRDEIITLLHPTHSDA
ncbi:MAG: ABC transporter ATP-binding protein, partial [Paracoccus sp. (in: a-proteobacteria)]